MPSALPAALLAASFGAAAGHAAAQSCSAVAPPTANTLVELYTSEGCSSCPPADRWLGALARRPDVVAVAFHVAYWDQLGWRDRFGSAAYSLRQERQRAVNGAPYPYTPQVVVDGRDRPDWSARGVPAATASTVPLKLRLQRDGDGVRAEVDALPGAPTLLAGWWAVTEDGHRTAVRAGENEGRELRHDAVVREWREVAAWTATPGQPLTLRFAPSTAVDAAHPRHVVLVVTDGRSGKPLQSLRLDC